MKKEHSCDNKQTLIIPNGDKTYKTKRKQLMSAHIEKSMVFKSFSMDPDPWETNSHKSTKNEADGFKND